ncbi:hypothetical protein ABVK25_008516 [Lepraria finkii]|uniref:Uncharacterized protein n=1 Tax=Lepraria finkii TaxID=1340010 RepID=A0ABR4B050_9LECA
MASKTSLNGFALITGAASGVGQETGFSFAEAGVSGVLFADMNGQGAQESAESRVDTAIKEFGRIDHSVNSAGV